MLLAVLLCLIVRPNTTLHAHSSNIGGQLLLFVAADRSTVRQWAWSMECALFDAEPLCLLWSTRRFSCEWMAFGRFVEFCVLYSMLLIFLKLRRIFTVDYIGRISSTFPLPRLMWSPMPNKLSSKYHKMNHAILKQIKLQPILCIYLYSKTNAFIVYAWNLKRDHPLMSQ